jgi:hypothetical protein
MSIVNTGVFATGVEIDEVRAASESLHSTPLIFPSGLKSARLMDATFERFKNLIDELAQKHGLPAPGLIDGEVNHYGMSNSGEFTRYEPDEAQS